MPRAVGIDLGTTYTVVATIEDGRPRTVLNADGQLLTPSAVLFAPDGPVLVGEAARRQAADNPEATVFSIKRHMGSDYKVRVTEREYTAPQVSGFILRKVKSDAEARLGECIDRAVITVPAYFNDRQRQATREAAALAGLDVLRMLNEPTAAALAYGMEKEDAQTMLVWDLGGGTFDVSILELGDGIFEVRAVSGDTWLGGDDFDQRVTQHLIGEYRRLHGDHAPLGGAARQRLREAAEQAKITLSSSPSTRLHVQLLDGLSPLEAELTREQLDGMTTDLLDRMAVCTRQALADAELRADAIDRVILVGGATRMPAVRALARRLLGREPYRYIDPDQAVAWGAAIQAGMVLGTVRKVVLLDVLPLSLGVETQGGLVARIIPRNTPLPASGSRLFTTAVDNQTCMDIHVLQGEREMSADNISLGIVLLRAIPESPRGIPRIEVGFEVDVDGIVHISAVDLLSEHEVKAKVTSTKLLDQREIAEMGEEAARNAERDREQRGLVEATIEARSLLAAAETVLKNLHGRTGETDENRLHSAMNVLKQALASGTSQDVRLRNRELRQLVAALYESHAGNRPIEGLAAGRRG